MANIRLYQFPSKASPTSADIIYGGDAANSFNEVQMTIAQLISAYPNLSNLAGLTLGANSYSYNNSGNTPTAGTITALAVSLLADSTTAAMQTTLGNTATPTASSFAGWDANSNLSANNFIAGYATTVTAASSTTLTVASAYQQYFTGTTTQTVLMPVTSTLVLGQSYFIVNNSTGVVTVQSSGTNTIKAMTSGTSLLVTCISTSGTTAASWNAIYLTDNALSTPISLANGGTNNALTASAGGILWSDSTKLNILAGTSTAGQLLLSGNAATPTWTTSTYPSTNAANTLLYASSANTMAALATGNNGVLITSGGGVPSISSTLPSAVQLNITSVGTIATGVWQGTVTGTLYGGTGVASVTIAPTASAFAGWDANSNLSANNFIGGYATTATAASTTTLTVSSAQQQYFTGTTTQTVLLPVTSTLVLGQSFIVVNNSTGVVTVQSSGANTIQAMAASTTAIYTCILTSGTTAASWNVSYINAAGGSNPWSAGTGATSAKGGSGTTAAGGDNSVAYGSNCVINSGATAGVNFGASNRIFANAVNCVVIGQQNNVHSTNTPANSILLGDQNISEGSHQYMLGSGHTTAGYNPAYCVLLGYQCSAQSNFTVGAGRSVTVINPGSFVFGDDSGTANSDSASNQFVCTFAGGYYFYQQGAGSPILTASFTPTGSSITGTTTNNNASAGYVGEVISSFVLQASAVSLTSATSADITSISLTAGDWDVYGNVVNEASGPLITIARGWISTTSATLPDNSKTSFEDSVGGFGNWGVATPTLRLSLSTTTTVYLSTQVTLTSGTCTGSGGIYARRAR